MNNRFSEYVKGSAFTLVLSKHMINSLLAMKEGMHEKRLMMGYYHALERRGLVQWAQDEDSMGSGGFITIAGKMVCSLLEHAGYSIDLNTIDSDDEHRQIWGNDHLLQVNSRQARKIIELEAKIQELTNVSADTT